MIQVAHAPSLQERMSLMNGWITAVVIYAPQQLVWEQVTDFKSYSNWNPFVLQAEAQFEVGMTIRFLEDMKQYGQHWINAKFLSIDPPHRFVWEGHFGASFLFTVCHTFRIEVVNDHQTRFIQRHENSGLLIPYLALRGVYCVSHQGYLDFNQALKERCEQMVATN
ncbi:MAG: SRPBCC domain-containing protein [Cyanobacteria bacterium P01_E01_bin.6]